jgi:hypothetical protein
MNTSAAVAVVLLMIHFRHCAIVVEPERIHHRFYMD